MSNPPRRLTGSTVAARVVAILAAGAFWLPLAAGQEPAKRQHVALDLRTPLGRLADLSLFGPAVETVARTDELGLRFTVPAGRKNVGVLGVEWTGRLRGDFDVTVGYELIAVGAPLPQYGTGVSLRLSYDTPVATSTVLSRLSRPVGERFVAQRVRQEAGGKEQYLNTKFAQPTGPKGSLRMVRQGSRVRFLAAEGGDFTEVQALDIGTADVRGVQLVCTTQFTPIALEARFTRLDLRADRVLGSWVEPEPRPGQHRLTFDLRTPVDQLSGLSLFGPTVGSVARTEAKGLHLSQPAGRQDTNPVGLELAKRLSGDFDVSFGYELLAVGEPLEKYGVALELKAWFDSPLPLSALLVRTRRTYGDRFVTFQVRKKPDGTDDYLDGKETVAGSPQGRLRLLRTGSTLHYLTSEGAGYRELRSFEVGTADVLKVQAQATTIWTPVLLEARFTDLDVQADQIQDQAIRTDAEPSPPGEETAISKRWLRLALFGGLGAVLALLAVGAWLSLRRRPRLHEAARPTREGPQTKVSR